MSQHTDTHTERQAAPLSHTQTQTHTICSAITHHIRHNTSQLINITRDLHMHWFTLNFSLIIHWIILSLPPSLYPSIIPHHLIPEARASLHARQKVNVTDLPQWRSCSSPSLLFHRNIPSSIHPNRLKSMGLPPPKIIHGSYSHSSVNIVLPYSPASSCRHTQAAIGSCFLSFKALQAEQSKLKVQPSLEPKPMWAIHTPAPVWG